MSNKILKSKIGLMLTWLLLFAWLSLNAISLAGHRHPHSRSAQETQISAAENDLCPLCQWQDALLKAAPLSPSRLVTVPSPMPEHRPLPVHARESSTLSASSRAPPV